MGRATGRSWHDGLRDGAMHTMRLSPGCRQHCARQHPFRETTGRTYGHQRCDGREWPAGDGWFVPVHELPPHLDHAGLRRQVVGLALHGHGQGHHLSQRTPVTDTCGCESRLEGYAPGTCQAAQ